MLGYEITPYKTEILIAYTDEHIIELYTKVLDFYYAKGAPFSIDVPDVPTPQLPSAYAIMVIIADKTDDPKKPEIHACSFATFGSDFSVQLVILYFGNYAGRYFSY
ncbi:hypothetical protein RhiirA4_478322 [Rhizophagus irregularis]|uniref:Uncharacterized protein n=1 Tax=Rhizophagus irregularis TaxID=588596 RepID=A0A2I1HER1_9GLOM|nr:hypothetical protein RhiirA4_478322 [Rhizophagus irregularis]